MVLNTDPAADLPQGSSMIDVEWRTSCDQVAYPQAIATMETRVENIVAGRRPELVWLLEHPPLYTAGTSAAEDELLDHTRFPVYRAGRGGRYTYHGPGQRVVYLMLDLRRRGRDLRRHVWRLEEMVIRTLATFDVVGERRDGRIGIWVNRPLGGEAKIGAIGVRVRKWVTYHGIAINVTPDLSHFSGIIPCGISDFGVTSLKALGVKADFGQVDRMLRQQFEIIFEDE